MLALVLYLNHKERKEVNKMMTLCICYRKTNDTNEYLEFTCQGMSRQAVEKRVAELNATATDRTYFVDTTDDSWYL
jgi:hypothetical protein